MVNLAALLTGSVHEEAEADSEVWSLSWALSKRCCWIDFPRFNATNARRLRSLCSWQRSLGDLPWNCSKFSSRPLVVSSHIYMAMLSTSAFAHTLIKQWWHTHYRLDFKSLIASQRNLLGRQFFIYLPVLPVQLLSVPGECTSQPTNLIFTWTTCTCCMEIIETSLWLMFNSGSRCAINTGGSGTVFFRWNSWYSDWIQYSAYRHNIYSMSL